MKSLYQTRARSQQQGTGLEIKIITPPAVEVLTLAEAKAFCRIDGIDDDATIQNLIVACRKEAERITNRAFITQTIMAEWSRMFDYVFLPRPPHQLIVSVETYDGSAWQTLSSSGYRQTGLNCFRIDVNRTFSTTAWSENPFRVQFVAGEGDDDEHIDERIKPAILDMILVAVDNKGQTRTSDGAELAGLMTPTALDLLSGLTTYR